jgi:hypothetical protein
LALSLAVLVAAGFYSKLGYRGPGEGWVRASAGGFFYDIFWCLAIVFVAPRARPAWVAIAVLVATCALEFLQLWHPPPLEWARSFFIGRTILGTDFSWGDFPFYFLGSAAGWVWLRALETR